MPAVGVAVMVALGVGLAVDVGVALSAISGSTDLARRDAMAVPTMDAVAAGESRIVAVDVEVGLVLEVAEAVDVPLTCAPAVPAPSSHPPDSSTAESTTPIIQRGC